MHKFEIAYSENKFWIAEQDDRGEYEREVTSWNFANKLANGFRWGMKYKSPKQRKYRISSIVTLSIEPMLSAIVFHLKEGETVVVLTPDVEIIFFNR